MWGIVCPTCRSATLSSSQDSTASTAEPPLTPAEIVHFQQIAEVIQRTQQSAGDRSVVLKGLTQLLPLWLKVRTLVQPVS